MSTPAQASATVLAPLLSRTESIPHTPSSGVNKSTPRDTDDGADGIPSAVSE